MTATASRPRSRSDRDPTGNPRPSHQRHPDAPVPNRKVSSLAMVSACIRQVRIAVTGADEVALRTELLRLSEEAALLATQHELLPTPVGRRQFIAGQRDRSPRAGSS